MFRCCLWSHDLIDDFHVHPGPWSTGLCHCHLNPTNAIFTALLPCITYGHIKEVLDEGKSSCCAAGLRYLLLMPVFCCQWTIGRYARKRLRRKYNLEAAPFSDAFPHIFCPWCALCQEFRELQIRGRDPALGWKGIVAKLQSEREAKQQNTPRPPSPTTSTPPSPTMSMPPFPTMSR